MKEDLEAAGALRRKAELNATLSSCCGVLGEVTLTDSAVIILFAGMLGAGDMLSLITTSFLPLFNGLFIIPLAWLVAKMGAKRLVLRSSVLMSAAFLLAVAAPFFGSYAAIALLGGIMLFSLFFTGFVAGWYPLVDTFVVQERRTAFFSKMRFFHQLTSTAFLFAVGLLIGKTPPLWALQGVMLAAGVIFLGRAFFIERIPAFTTARKDSLSFSEGLAAAVANKPLTGFSIYLFVLNLAAYGATPLTMLYLKRHLGAPDNVVVIISSMALLGMLLGYLGVGWIVKRSGTRGALLGFHVVFAVVNLLLFSLGKGGLEIYVLIGALMLVYCFALAGASIVTATEMLLLSQPDNKTMSLALCGAFCYGGSGLSRFLGSLVLGAGLLAPQWTLCGTSFTCYQTLFLIYGVGVVFAAVFLLMVPAVFPVASPRDATRSASAGPRA